MKREVDSLLSKLSEEKLSSVIASAEMLTPYRFISATLEMKPDEARNLCDAIKGRFPDAVAVFAVVSDDKLNFLSVCGTDAVKNGAHAGELLREVSAVAGGKGGGRADFAMSGGRDRSKIADALALAKKIVSKKASI